MLYSSLMTSISTHGPARGPTGNGRTRILRRRYFNSRPREGADKHVVILCLVGNISTHGPARGPTKQESRCWSEQTFQLTAPRGGRHFEHHENNDTFSFQLTAPRGGRHPLRCKDLQSSPISTHGPARGPTCNSVEMDFGFDISTHTAPRGGPTMFPLTPLPHSVISTSRPRGADGTPDFNRSIIGYFTHGPARG